MIDNIINSVKGQLTGELQNKFNLNPTQADQSVDLAKDNLQHGLKQQASSGDLSSIMGMLNGKQAPGSNPAVQGMANNYISDLTTKLGIPAGIAQQAGPFVINFLMSKLSGKVMSEGLGGSALMGMLGGGGGTAGNGASGGGLKDTITKGIGGKLGGLFK